MSPQTIISFLSFHLLSSIISNACIPEWAQSTQDCADDYQAAIMPHTPECLPDPSNCLDFLNYLSGLGDPLPSDATWYSFWESQQDTITIDKCDAIIPIKDQLDNTCDAIIPIKDQLDNTCLCQLQQVCNGLCDTRIQGEFVCITEYMVYRHPYRIPWEFVDQTDCQNVWNVISTKYQNLCPETELYKLIKGCADGSIQSGTPLPTISPNPTISPTTTTIKPTTSVTTTTVSTSTGISSNDTAVVTTNIPTAAPSAIVGDGTTNIPDNDYNATESSEDTPTPTELVNNTVIEYSTTPDSYEDGYGHYNDDIPLSTEFSDIVLTPDSHPFANLLLVSLIILGFCVFVAWYAKKNQITSPSMNNNNDDNGYLWGLNKSSPSGGDNIISDDGDKYNKNKKFTNKSGKFKHKKLSQFDDELIISEQMNIQMTINNKNNNDLLAITPDHIGRIQTHQPPHNIAPNIPHNRHNNKKHKKKRRVDKGGSFQPLKDDDPDMNTDSNDSTDSDSSGVDMMKMRDEYYASQTFSKKLADTLGDISETVKDAAAVVKTKLTKREQTVVRPMQIKIQKNKKIPFRMVEDNETTDGFDLSGGDNSESSSTKEDEYKDDPETEVRVNIHGRKIKQPMKLPTFENINNSNDDQNEINMLAQSHSHTHTHGKKDKKKKKKDKKKKKKKDKERKKDKHNKDKNDKQVIENNHEVRTEALDKNKNKNIDMDKMEVSSEAHDINIHINNSDNMGFGSDELNDDNIELTNEDVTMTMNDLQMELMKHNNKENDNDNDINNDMNNDNNKVDLSFMDNITNDNNNVDDLVDLANGNGVVVGNGNNNVIEQN